MKKTKATFLAIILLLALLCAVTIWYGTTEIAYAETTGQDLETLCKEYTADKSETLDNYESYLETRFQLSNFHNNDRTITDEWIMRIVPKTLFEQKLRNFLYLGEKYGFYFDYRNDSNVFIYFIKHEINTNISGQITRRIEPFYYEMYCYDPQSGTASMQHFTDTITNPNGQVLDTQNFYRKYSQAHSLFLKNVSFSGSIYNENHLNVGESGYVAEEDNGAYFFGGSYVFHGVTGQSTGLGNLYFDMLKIGVGLSSQPLGTALSFFDLKNAMGGFIQEATHDFRGEIGNDKFSDTKQFIELDLKKQIDNLGAPARTFGTITESPNSGASALFGIGGGNYIENTYFYNFANQNKQWNSSMVTRISFDIVENDFLTGTKTIAEHVDSNNMLTSLYDEERIVLTESVVSSVYALPNKTCPLSFVAPYNGLYVFTSQGFVKNQFISDIGEKTQSSDNINQTLMVELQKGQIFNLLTKNLSTDKYSYKVSVKFLPHSIDLGDNSLKLKFDETYIQFTSPKNLNYRFTLDNNADVLHLLNSNFEVVQTSAAGELLAILNANETYYLRIDRSGSETKTVNLTVNDEMYVFFENVEGITSEIPEKITISSTGSVSLPTPEKRGYTFEGWWTNLDAYGENVTNDNIFDYLRPELHLSAKWTPIHYTIFYEENGGDTIPDGDYIIEHVVTLNQNITKAGFVFCGWYDNPALGGVEIKTFPAGNIGNKTFYAKWVKEKFTIRFDMNSAQADNLLATFDPSDNIVDNQKEVYYKKPFTLPTPSLLGFDFDGWFYQGNLVTASNLYEFENDIELIAKWNREKYHIKVGFKNDAGAIAYKWLNSYGKDLTFNDEKGNPIGYNLLSPNNYIAQLKFDGNTNQNNAFLESLYKVGHKFVAFVFDASVKKPIVFDWGILTKENIQDGNIIALEAYYETEKDFKIYVEDVTGVTGTQGNLPTKNFGEVIDYKTAPSRIGYSFSGYVVSGNAHNSVFIGEFKIGQPFNYIKMPDISQNREMDGEIIYIMPVFTPNNYIVSFDIEEVEPLTVTFDQAYNTSSGNAFPVPKKFEHDFKGWFTKENGEGNKIADENGNLLNDKWNILRNISLYSYWERNTFTITLVKEGGTGGTDSIKVKYNEFLPPAIAPKKTGHYFLGYFSLPNGEGSQYYDDGYTNLIGVNKWTSKSDGTLYAYWVRASYILSFDQGMSPISAYYGDIINLPEAYKMGYECIWTLDGNDVDSNNYVVTKPGKFIARFEPRKYQVLNYYMSYDDNFIQLIKDGYETYDVDYMVGANDVEGYTFDHWEKLIFRQSVTVFEDKNFRTSPTIIYRNACNANGECYYDYTTIIFAIYTKNCVAEGTLITLSDGTQKAVEDLTGSEQLLVWNLFTGTFDTAPILFIDHDPAREYEVINLAFSDETTVKVISEHGFWDFDLNEYVFLRRDAAKYIGHWFNKQTTDAEGKLGWTKVQLVNVKIQKEITTAWSPVTYGHLCYYVNGMLSMPGATEGLINIFDVDPNTLKIDEAKYNADIAEYGLYTYEEFAETYPVPEVIFEAFGGQYLKVSIGKGLIDRETLGRLIERYAKFFA